MAIDIAKIDQLSPPFNFGSFDGVITIEEALWTLLTQDLQISGLAGTRVYPFWIPQNVALPAITYQVISANRGYTFLDQNDLVEKRVQVNVWGNTYSQANVLKNYVRQKLSNYSGIVSDRDIKVIFLDNEGDVEVLSSETSVLKRYGKRLDFLIWYKETL